MDSSSTERRQFLEKRPSCVIGEEEEKDIASAALLTVRKKIALSSSIDLSERERERETLARKQMH